MVDNHGDFGDILLCNGLLNGDMMKRTLDRELQAWRTSPRRKPLLLRGARQVGKTYAVRALGKRFQRFVEINFEETPDARLLFRDGFRADTLVEKFSAYARTRIVPGETLLFFDEVQSCPEALAALRYLYEGMPDLHVAAAGSLLEFAIQKIPSLGGGRISSLCMYPMTFPEFLQALGEDGLLDFIEGCDFSHPLDEAFHRRALSLLRTYMLVGGMPAAVSEYVQSRDLNAVMDILDDLIETFTDDFSKYRRRYAMDRLVDVFRSVTLQTGGRFVCATVDREAKSTSILGALNLLEMAGLVHKAVHTDARGVSRRSFSMSASTSG
jgi:predicted AAA+ superfamily ATPase